MNSSAIRPENGPAEGPAGEPASESEAKYREILETIEDAYYEVDLRGNVVMCNSAFCRMLGYSHDELVGRNNREFQTPQMAAQVFDTFHGVYRTGMPAKRCDWELIRRDGSTLVAEGSVQLVRNRTREAAGFRGILRDVTELRQMEQALRASESRYRSIIETIEDPYYEVDLRGTLVLVNSAFARMLGYPESELVGHNHREFQSPEVSSSVYKIFNAVYRTGVPTNSFEWEMVRKDGKTVTGDGSVQLVRDVHGEPSGFRGILRDVTERRKIEMALRESEARFRALTHLSSDWYWEQDAFFRYRRMESREERHDSVQHTLIGKCPWESELQIKASGGWEEHRALLAAREPFRDVVMYRLLDDGSPYYISVSGEAVFDVEGNFTGYRGVSREITDKKIAEERIQHLATHDTLTGLPNRAMFSHLLGAAIMAAKRYGRKSVVMFIDLDRFKFINDTLGHEAGDKLLKVVSGRFRKALRASDVVARLGGDEFVVLLHEIHDEKQACTVARKLLTAAIRPVRLMDRECRVTASIGIAMYPQDGDDEQALMKNADIAMYYAKEEGKNNFQFFSKDIRSQSLERLTLENNLRTALERRELSLHYQAKRNLATGGITGVEALLRWNNRELGAVTPMQFIPVAEETGLIIPIGKWVLKTACEQNMAWQRMGLPPLRMSVNISVRQFADDRLLDDLSSVLAETRMPPHLLELEITESIVVQNPTQALKLLTAIKKMGVRLAIDDFGTGYSSLGQLKHFPIDTLKVDRSFIRDIETNPGDKAITDAIIAMSKTLSLTVVAEGVETAGQEQFLREHACDEMQGYFFSKPVPAEELALLLKAHSAS